MKKRICKATNNSKIKRADFKYQLLFNELGRNISAYRLHYVLNIINSLPKLNNRHYMVRNKHGVCIELVSKKGKSKYIGIDLCGGIFYFDGNRIGKRKLKLLKTGMESGEFTEKLENKFKFQTI